MADKEVHQNFKHINLDEYKRIIRFNNSAPIITTLATNIKQQIINYINNATDDTGNLVWSPTKQQELIEQLEKIFHKVKQCSDYFKLKKTNILIKQSFDFAFKQPNIFKNNYIESFIKDNAEAFSTGTDNISCDKGIYERFVLSMVPAITSIESSGILLDPDTQHMYDELKNALSPPILPILQEWLNEMTRNPDLWINLTPEQRMNYLTQRIIQRTNMDEITITRLLNQLTYWNYYSNIINMPGEIQLGGKKQKRKRKFTKKSKKSTKKQSRRFKKRV